jgi:hypothetical protein
MNAQADGRNPGVGNRRARGRGASLLHNHIEGGKHLAADVVAQTQAVLSEPELLRAMFDIGYFPQKTPPNE